MKICKKKGFTLIEIIICVAILSVVGVTSFVGISFALKNIRINKLSDIEEDILTAAKIYLETNKEVSEQVYSKNEGLLDLNGTDLKRNNIKDEYVYTSLSNSSSTSDDCIDLKTVTSWNESSSIPIYVCSKRNGDIIIQGSSSQTINKDAVEKQISYYYDKESNYIYYNDINNLFHLFAIDTDDGLILYNSYNL